MEEEKFRYLVMRGQMGIEVAGSNDLEEAKQIACDYDDELTSDEWDNLENHWILDTETDESIEVEY